MQKLNKIQKDRTDFLINNSCASNFHKTLLKGIKGNNFKNIGITDNEVSIDIFNKYSWVEE